MWIGLRQVVAFIAGFLVVALVAFAWLVVLVVAAVGSTSLAGQSADNDPLASFATGLVIASIIAGSVMYFALLGLGRWASDTPESRTATIVAGVVTGVFAAAAIAILAVEVVGYIRG